MPFFSELTFEYSAHGQACYAYCIQCELLRGRCPSPPRCVIRQARRRTGRRVVFLAEPEKMRFWGNF